MEEIKPAVLENMEINWQQISLLIARFDFSAYQASDTVQKPSVFRRNFS